MYRRRFECSNKKESKVGPSTRTFEGGFAANALKKELRHRYVVFFKMYGACVI